MIQGGEGFESSYDAARTRWLAAVRRHGGTIDSVIHPERNGPAGEPLATDWASFGEGQAPRVLLVTCGTHGIEGFAGSAVLCAWLEAQAPAIPRGVRLVLVHAVNPWGFAHGQRVTEHNVDLNRNFIDFSTLPANSGYAELHPALMLADWSEAAVARAFAAMDDFRARHGEKAFSDAFNGGQYEHADGLFYGGREPQWSNLTLRSQLRLHLAKAEQVHLLDLHTGIGPYGEPFHINFDPPQSPRRQAAERLWGAEALSGQGSTHAAFATYQGLLIDAFAAELPHAKTSSVVVEFGTHPRPRMQRAHLALAWMRRQPSGPASTALHDARETYSEAFIPSDPTWRRQVVHRGVALCARGLAALVTDPFESTAV